MGRKKVLTAKEAKKRYNERRNAWTSKNLVIMRFSLRIGKDDDLIEFLSTQENKGDYIKEALREYIAKKG